LDSEQDSAAAMIEDLPGVIDAPEPLLLADPGTAVALMIAIRFVILEGYSLLWRNIDKGIPSQETALATEDMLKNIILKMKARKRGVANCGGQAFLRPYRLSGEALAAAIEPARKRAATRPRPDSSSVT
jgi:hypothetical protein